VVCDKTEGIWFYENDMSFRFSDIQVGLYEGKTALSSFNAARELLLLLGIAIMSLILFYLHIPVFCDLLCCPLAN